MCGQVWWPILGICPLHLTHPSAHSQQWTHTRSSGQPYCGARGAVGGSVPCSRVSPQSWYWRWREHLLFTPPTDNPCRTWESNRQPLGYKSNSLTIRPRLPWMNVNVKKMNVIVSWELFLAPLNKQAFIQRAWIKDSPSLAYHRGFETGARGPRREEKWLLGSAENFRKKRKTLQHLQLKCWCN